MLVGCVREQSAPEPIVRGPCFTPFNSDFHPTPTAEGLRYFVSPELGPRTVTDFTRIRPACEALRNDQHAFFATMAGNELAHMSEPSLLQASREQDVLRVLVLSPWDYQSVVYRLERRDAVWMLTASWLVQRVDSHRPDSGRDAYLAWAAANLFPEHRVGTVLDEQATALWRLQAAVQPRPEGFVGVTDPVVMIVETVEGGRRNARAMVMEPEGATAALFEALEGASHVGLRTPERH